MMKISAWVRGRTNTHTGAIYTNCGRQHRNLYRPCAKHPKEQGQELIEFAVIFAILILFIFGILDFGRLFFTSITIVNSAREGARYAMQFPDDLPGIISKTQQEAASTGIDLTDGAVATISVSCPPALPPPPVDGCTSGEPVRVRVDYIFDPVMDWLFPGTLTITRFAEMITP